MQLTLKLIVLSSWFVWAVPTGTTAQVVRVADVPLPASGTWSVDLTGSVERWALDSIDRLGNDVDRQLDGQIAVVVIDSLAAADVHAFAVNLFNAWGVGDRERDNGILLFVALRNRAAEIVLGDGIDDRSQEAMADQIMQQLMVPRLRTGDVTNAMLLGTQASVERILRPLRPDVAIEPIGNLPLEADGDAQASSLAESGTDSVPERRRVPLTIIGVVGAAGTLLFGAGRWRRNRPRDCTCGGPRVKLGEAADDAYLDSGERAEEAVGSVDYDVWLCSRCDDAEKLRYATIFTRYSTCPECQAKTKNKKSRTVRQATHSSTGLVELTERCAHCNYIHRYHRTTPRITSSSGSSSSGSSSFGGGSSSGGGASGSW